MGLQKIYAARPDKGLKSQAEDDMVGDVHAHDLQPEPARLVDRHAAAQFIPASMSITCTRTRSSRSRRRKHCVELTKEIFGGEMDYVPWMRPGFELGLAMQEICREEPEGEARS